jgi:FKBP-type peptidyl-prolyl cis-trans isomerase
MLLTNGVQVDSSAGLTIRLQGGDPIIKGWRLGIPGMKVGGSRVLIIPPELGYEWRQVGKIPPNSTLLFRVQLMAVE